MAKCLITIILIYALSSCNRTDHYLINCCEVGDFSVDHDGILFLTESANYQSLQTLRDTARLKQLLSENEMKSAFDTTVEIREFDTLNYYNTELVPWDTLFVTENFSAELVLLIDNINTRGYYFQIRTYTKNGKLIAIQDFATWADKIKKYCSGDFLIEKQTFTVTCDDIKMEYKFDERGEIIPIN